MEKKEITNQQKETIANFIQDSDGIIKNEIGEGNSLNPINQENSFQKRIDFIKSYEIRESLPWINNDVVKYLYQGVTSGERAIFAQRLPEEIQASLNLENPFILKKEVLESIAQFLNSKNGFLTKKEANLHIAEKPSRIASNQSNDNGVWNQIKQMDIIDYICREMGGEIKKDSSSRNTTVIKLPKTNEKLLVKKYDEGNYGVANDTMSFKGSNISFIAAYVLNYQDTKSKEALRDVVAHLREKGYVQDNKVIKREVQYKYADKSVNEESIKSKPTKQPKPKHFVNLKYPAYLIDRGILPSTLNSAPFRGMVLNSYIEGSKSDLRNIAFKLRDRDNKLFTHLEKNQNYQKFQKDISTSGLLFISNPPQEQCKHIVISEAPIDLLSYAQLNGIDVKHTLYISTGGNINDGQINLINALIDSVIEERSVTIHLANDNDLGGIMFDYKLSYAILQHNLEKTMGQFPSETLEKAMNEHSTSNDMFYEIVKGDMSKEEKIEAAKQHYFDNYGLSIDSSSVNGNSIVVQVNKASNGKDWNEQLTADYNAEFGFTRLNIVNTDKLPEFKDFLAQEQAAGSHQNFLTQTMNNFLTQAMDTFKSDLGNQEVDPKIKL